MINILLWAVLALITFFSIMASYRLFGKTGLYIFSAFSIILANIQVLKVVQLFGLVATLGNIIYGASFLITDIITEIYGEKQSKKAVWIGFFSAIVSTLIMWICIQFIPHSTDFAQESLKTIFSIMPRIVVASLIAYLISNFHDVWAFNFWKKKTKGKYLWFRNNMSTLVSQLIDSVIFSTIAFLGMFSTSMFFEIIFTTYLFKSITSILDTPFVYWAKNIYKKNKHKIEFK